MESIRKYFQGFKARMQEDASKSWEINLLAVIGYLILLIYGYRAIDWFAGGGLWIFALLLYLCLLIGPISRWLGSMAGPVLMLVFIWAVCQSVWLDKIQICNTFKSEMSLDEKAIAECKENGMFREALGERHNAMECRALAEDYGSSPQLIERCKAVRSFRAALIQERNRSLQGHME